MNTLSLQGCRESTFLKRLRTRVGIIVAVATFGSIGLMWGSTAPALAATNCASSVAIVINGADGQLDQYSTTGTRLTRGTTSSVLGDIGITPDGSLYGVPYNNDPATQLLRLDPATGATLDTISLSGPVTTVLYSNGMSGLTNGHLLLGSALTSTLYEIDPATGVSTVYARSLPANTVSAGDFFEAHDGDLIAVVSSSIGVELVRIHPDNTSTVVGTLPLVYGGTVSGDHLYLAGADGTGTIYELATIPSVASTAALPVTPVGNTGFSNYGAASTQEASACLAPALTSAPSPVAPSATLTSTGTGWPGNTSVTVTYTDAAGRVVGRQTVSTSDDGSFVAPWIVPAGTAPGTLHITATYSAGDSVTSAVTITQPTVATSADDGRAGQSITVSGSGYPPTSTITVTLVDPAGVTLATVPADTDPTGAFSTTVTIPASAPAGTATVQISDSGGSVLASSFFTITAVSGTGPSPGAGATTPAPAPSATTLARTGSTDTGMPAALALLLSASGIGLFVSARRRREHSAL